MRTSGIGSRQGAEDLQQRPRPMVVTHTHRWSNQRPSAQRRYHGPHGPFAKWVTWPTRSWAPVKKEAHPGQRGGLGRIGALQNQPYHNALGHWLHERHSTMKSGLAIPAPGVGLGSVGGHLTGRQGDQWIGSTIRTNPAPSHTSCFPLRPAPTDPHCPYRFPLCDGRGQKSDRPPGPGAKVEAAKIHVDNRSPRWCPIQRLALPMGSHTSSVPYMEPES
jgi:hypothetical protein